jgi:hypothetical protein
LSRSAHEKAKWPGFLPHLSRWVVIISLFFNLAAAKEWLYLNFLLRGHHVQIPQISVLRKNRKHNSKYHLSITDALPVHH